MSKLGILKQPNPQRGGRSITILVVSDIVAVMRTAPSTRLYFDLIQDLVDRDRMGFEKYGQNLETHDGRDTLGDLYQEILDAIQYSRKYLEEDIGDTRIAHVYAQLIRMAREILEEEERREQATRH